MKINNSFFKDAFEICRDTFFVAVGCWVGKEIAQIGWNNYGAKIARNSEMAGFSTFVNWFALEILLNKAGVKEGDIRSIATASICFIATLGLMIASKTSSLARCALAVSYAGGLAILTAAGVYGLYNKGKSFAGY